MADNVCYKCRATIPAGAEVCPGCGAPAPLPDEEIDKYRIRSRTGFDASGRIIIPEPATGADSSTRIVMPEDSSTRIVMPDDSSTRIVMPDDSSTRIVMPDDSSTRIVMPDDSSTRIVMPDDSSTRIVMPDDSSTRIVMPDDSSTRIVMPDDSSTRIVMPDDSSTRIVTSPVPPVPPVPPVAPGKPRTEAPRKPAPKKKKKKGGAPVGIVLAVLVVVFIAAIGAYMFFSGNRADANAETCYALVDAPLYSRPAPASVTDTVPYGTAVRVTGREDRYSRVTYTDASGAERTGYVEDNELISGADMGRLNSILSGTAALRAVDRPEHRRALIAFVENSGYDTAPAGENGAALANPSPYRFMPVRAGDSYANLRYGRWNSPDSHFEDLALIVNDVNTGTNTLVYITIDNYMLPAIRRTTVINDHSVIEDVNTDPSLPSSQRVTFITR